MIGGPRLCTGAVLILLCLADPLAPGVLSRVAFTDHYLTNATAQKAATADARKIVQSFPTEHATFTVDRCHHVATSTGLSRHVVDCRVTYLFAVSRIVCRSTTRVAFRSARSSAVMISYPERSRCS